MGKDTQWAELGRVQGVGGMTVAVGSHLLEKGTSQA